MTVFREFQGCEKLFFLSITVCCEVQATKHCHAPKFQNFTESALGLAVDARNLKFLIFVEHYRVS